MSAAETAAFDACRALKRERMGEGLSEGDVAQLRAIFDGWKNQTGPVNPTGLADSSLFFASVRNSFGALKQSQIEGIEALLQAFATAAWPIAFTAYGLATAWHETATRMEPVEEAYWLKPDAAKAYFFKMYDPQGSRPAVAKALGNTVAGDGARFPGRGYPQTTGRANYLKAGTALGIDLVAHPERMLEPEIAAAVMVKGMEQGWFTGKRLGDYLPRRGKANAQQFTLARYIINGTDKAAVIAAHALSFQNALAAGGWA